MKQNYLILLLVFTLSSCSLPTPKFNRPYLPEQYKVKRKKGSSARRKSIEPTPINDNQNINRKVINFWLRGHYDSIYRQYHPILPLRPEELHSLLYFLDYQATIYYPESPVTEPVVRKLLKSISCTPLSNAQISYMMNTDKTRPFPRKALTLFFITVHELLQQKGFQPIYPKVYSPKLRKKLELQPLKSLESFNLFAEKWGKGVYPNIAEGIIVCRNSTKSGS